MVHRNIYTHSIENTHKSNTSVTTTHILKHTAQREARGGAPEQFLSPCGGCSSDLRVRLLIGKLDLAFSLSSWILRRLLCILLGQGKQGAA